MSNLIYPNSTTLPLSQNLQEPSLSSSTNSSFPTPAQNVLRDFFSQIDLHGTGQISHKDLAARISSVNIRFHDKESYRTFLDYPTTHSHTMTFSQFLQLAEELKFSPIDCWKMTNTVPLNDISPNFFKVKANQPVRHEEVKQVNSQEKNDVLCKAFQTLDRNGTGKIDGKGLIKLLDDVGYEWNREDIDLFFQELDFEDKAYITVNNVIDSYITKKASLFAHNMTVLAKIIANPQEETIENFICLVKYKTKKHVSEEDLLDLFQVFEQFDYNGKTIIQTELIRNLPEELKRQLNENEKTLFTNLTELPVPHITFEQFFQHFGKQNSNVLPMISLATKFNRYWSQKKHSKTDKTAYASTLIMEEEKSPLHSTMDSLQSFAGAPVITSSLEEVTLMSSTKKQSSILSASDVEINQYRSKSATYKEQPKNKISSIQDGLELESINIKSSMNLDLKELARSSITDSTTEITPELKYSQKPWQEGQKKELLNPCSLESLVEDEDTASKVQSSQIDDHETLRLENMRLKQYIQEKEAELFALIEGHSASKSELEDEVALKNTLITRISKEQEAVKAHLGLAKEEIDQLKVKMSDSALKLKKANDEALTMKTRLAIKVKEALIQKEKFDAMEKQYNDKNREIDTLMKKKVVDEKAYQDNITSMKGKLTYLTQKFTEYLTQNTSLQSELQEKNTAARKMDTAFKDQMRKMDDQKQKLDLKIVELEKQLSFKAPPVCEKAEKQIGTDVPFSPQVSKRHMEQKLAEAVTQNESLRSTCTNFKKEADKLKSELQNKNQEVCILQEYQDKYSKELLKCEGLRQEEKCLEANEGLAKTLIESLQVQLETMKREKETLEKMFGVANVDLESEKVKCAVLTTKVDEYQLEFKYLNECLSESLCRGGGSNDSVIIFAHERNDEHLERNSNGTEGNLTAEEILAKDPRESLKVVKKYVGKLETLEQRTKGLDEEIEMMNHKIEVLRRKNSEEDQESGDKKGILDVYKKLIENKQLEIESLKKRVRGKTGLVSANMRLLSKLEALFTDKLTELSEVSENQDKLAGENRRLNMIIKEQTNEIEKFRKGGGSNENGNKALSSDEQKRVVRQICKNSPEMPMNDFNGKKEDKQ